jgi:hypothetical protein
MPSMVKMLVNMKREIKARMKNSTEGGNSHELAKRTVSRCSEDSLLLKNGISWCSVACALAATVLQWEYCSTEERTCNVEKE